MKIKYLLLLAAMGSSLLSASAQSTVSGTVVDKYGTPISGAKVQVVGTTTQTETDFNGRFTLSSMQHVKKISISAPGRTTRVRKYKGSGRQYELRNSSFWYQPIDGWRPFVLFEMAVPSAKRFDCFPVGAMVGTYCGKFGMYGKFVLSKSLDADDKNWNVPKERTGDVKGALRQFGGGIVFCPSSPLAFYCGASYMERHMACKDGNGKWIEVDEYCNSGPAVDFGMIFQYKHLMLNLGTSIYGENTSLVGNFGVGYLF